MELTHKQIQKMSLHDCEAVMEVINDYLSIDIRFKTRKRLYVDARKIYFKICRDHIKKASFKMIGESVNCDHATVMVNLQKLNDMMPFDKYLENLYLTLEALCLKNIENLRNPFEKYLGKEDHLQHMVMNYIKLQYPNVFAIHVPSEGKRTAFERYKFKYLGGTKGIPDVMIFHPKKTENDFKCGLAIELKVGYNKPTESQFRCLNVLENAKWESYWSNNFDEVKTIIDNYLK